MQAHLKADKFYSVVANMRGTSPEDVASKILSCEALRGLQVLSLSFHSCPDEGPGTPELHGIRWQQYLAKSLVYKPTYRLAGLFSTHLTHCISSYHQ